MNTFININDIDLLCNDPNKSNNDKTESGYNEQWNHQSESKSKCNGESTFRKKAKNIWGKIKRIVSVGRDILNTIVAFVNTVTVFVKCLKKMKGAFA